MLVNNRIPGCHLLERVTGGGSYTFYVPFFEIFVLSRSRFLNVSSALGPIFKFVSILGHKFSFVSSRTIKRGYPVRSRVPKMRYCVRSRKRY